MQIIIIILVLLCLVPKFSSLSCDPAGYYLATPLTGDYCNSCHAYCQTCDGAQNGRCLSCFLDDHPSATGRTCYVQTNFKEKITEFFETLISTTLPSYVTTSLSASNVATCMGQSWIGGPAIFGNGDWIQITYDFTEKHYCLRIKFRFLKVDAWSGQDGQVYVDGVLQNISVLTNIKATDGATYYGNICGGGVSDPENIYIVDYTMLHSQSSVVIKITTNLDGIKTQKSWGIRDLIIGIYACDISCVYACSGATSSDCTIPCWSNCETCTSILQTGCTSCKANYFLSQDGSCVTSCPSPLWGDVDQRKCVTTCPTLKQFGDTSDLRKCKSICPSPLYGVTSTETCESDCPLNLFKHDVDRICYAVCPSPYFGNSLTFKCVNPCPDGRYGDTVTKTCMLCSSSCYTCTSEFSTGCVQCYPHATNVGGQCICDETYYGVAKFCAWAQNCYDCKSCYSGCAMCSGSLANQCTKCTSGYFLKSDGTCVTICPTPYWGDSVAKTCVASCPNSNQYGDLTDRICKNCDTPCVSCLDNAWKCTSCSSPLFLRGNNCLSICPTPYYGIPTKHTCEVDCLVNQYKHDVDRICYDNCPAGYYADPSTKICVADCPTNYYADPSTKICVSACPTNYYADPTTKMCVTACPSGYYADLSTKMCVTGCPTTYYADPSTKTCVSTCPSGYYADPSMKMCVTTCPSGYYADLSTKMCVTGCPTTYYADPSTKTCVSTCTSGYYADPSTKMCVTSCPSGYYADLLTKICVTGCPTNYYADLSTKTCVSTCPSGYYADPSTKTCVNACPLGYYADPSTKTCVSTCSSGYYADLSTKICVTDCPTTYYADPSTKKCVSTCPSGYYADPSTKMCVTSCPSGYYADLSTKMCVTGCPTTYYADPSTKTCVSACSLGYYADPSSKMCVTDCPTNYYANPSTKICVTSCPSPYYAIKTTKTCDSNCPASQFKHDIDRLCYESCPINYYGNPLTGLCQNSCPNGMFGSISKICEYCSINCKNCQGSADFCLSCKYGWSLSGSSCTIPANFYQMDTHSISPYTDCGPYHIYGGYNSFGMNTYIPITYTNVVPHYKIRITFFFLKIDNWSSNKVFVYLNTPTNLEYEASSMTFAGEDSQATLFCGDAAKSEALRPFDVYTDHVLPDISIKISTDLAVSSSIASWGIFEFSISLERCHETCKTCSGSSSNQCTSCYPDASLTIGKSCICNNYYKATTVAPYTCATAICTTCDFYNCHASCNSCDGSSNINCLTCSNPRFLFNKQCLTICPAPLWGDPSSHKCETQCPVSKDIVTRTCINCDASCLTCSGPSQVNCLSCAPTKLLWSSPPEFKCLDVCPPPQVASPPLCVDCHPNCKTCDGAFQNDCLSCSSSLFLHEKKCLNSCTDPYFGVNSTKKCESSCPRGSFPNLNTRVCDSCATQCEDCINDKTCKLCSEGTFLEKGCCVKSCSAKSFPNDQQKCENCLENCEKCKSATSCETCTVGYYMDTNNETTQNCVLCQEGGWKEGGACYFCGDGCVECEAKDKCGRCQVGYGRKEGKCVKQVEVKGKLERDGNVPNRFHLKFDRNWVNEFKYLAQGMAGKVQGLNGNEYSIRAYRNETDSNDFVIDVSFKINVDEGRLLSITLNNVPTNEEYFIEVKEYSMILKEYYKCEADEKFDSDSKKCIKYIIVTPSLDYTALPNELTLKFDKEYSAYWNILPNNSIVEINDDIDFTYEFILVNSYQYRVKFEFNISVLSEPLCTIFLKVPGYLKYDKNNTFSLSEEAVSLNIRDYYSLSNAVKDAISTAKGLTTQMNTIASTTTMSNNFLSFGSSFAITSLMSMESIRFLKYLEINYPPNVEGMFMSSLPLPGIVPNVNIDEGTPEEEGIYLPFSFLKYETNLYVFNNNGNILIENGVYFLFACIILSLNKIFSQSRINLVKQIIGFFTAIFVWNFIISYYFGVFMNYIFFAMLYVRYPGTKRIGGYCNFGLAIFEIIFTFFTLFFLTRKIIQMHKQAKASHSNKIHPEIVIDSSSNRQDLIASPNAINPKFNQKNEAKNDGDEFMTGSLSDCSVLPLPTGSPSPQKSKKTSSSHKRFRVVPSEIAHSPEVFPKTKRRGFTPVAWHDIPSLPNPTIYGSKTLGKINPFEEAMTLSFKKTFTKLSRATSIWTGELQGVVIDTRYSCLYDDLSHESFGQSFFLMLDIFRQLLVAIMIVFSFNFPVVALGVINFVNFEMLVLIIFIRPLKKRIDLLHTSINEICVNVACWGSFTLANMDNFNYKDQQVRMNIGWAIVGANGVLMGAVLIRFGYVLVELVVCLVVLVVKKVRERRMMDQEKE